MSRLLLGSISLTLVMLAGFAGCATFHGTDDEEDRPPILVNNGSLVFESGARNRPGKPWDGKDGEFFPDHEQGRRVSAFQLYFTGGTGECRPTRTNSFTVHFDHDGDKGKQTPAERYTVTVRNPGSGKGRPGPSISGEGLRIDPTNRRRLVAWEGQGAIASVAGDDFTCTGPTEVWVESIRY